MTFLIIALPFSPPPRFGAAPMPRRTKCDVNDCAAGLLDQLLPASALARPATAVRSAQSAHGKDQAGGPDVDADLDPGHVFPQREDGIIPRHHRLQPATVSGPHRLPVVRNQVSNHCRRLVTLAFSAPYFTY